MTAINAFDSAIYIYGWLPDPHDVHPKTREQVYNLLFLIECVGEPRQGFPSLVIIFGSEMHALKDGLCSCHAFCRGTSASKASTSRLLRKPSSALLRNQIWSSKENNFHQIFAPHRLPTESFFEQKQLRAFPKLLSCNGLLWKSTCELPCGPIWIRIRQTTGATRGWLGLRSGTSCVINPQVAWNHRDINLDRAQGANVMIQKS